MPPFLALNGLRVQVVQSRFIRICQLPSLRLLEPVVGHLFFDGSVVLVDALLAGGAGAGVESLDALLELSCGEGLCGALGTVARNGRESIGYHLERNDCIFYTSSFSSLKKEFRGNARKNAG